MPSRSCEIVVGARGLRKTFAAADGARIVALDGIDVDLAPGEVLGLVGPNGAGKSTLVALTLGLLRPDEGEVRVLGATPGPATRARTGWVGAGERSWYLRLTARSNLQLFAGLQGLRGVERTAAIARVAGEHELGEFLDRRVSDLSTGMRARLELARACLHQPELLLLDEPARALDADSRERLRAFLRSGQSPPATIYVSHDLAEVEAVADRVAVLHEGRLRAIGPVAELTAALERPEPLFTVERAGEQPARGISAADLPEAVGGDGGLLRAERTGGDLRAVVASCDRLEPPAALPAWSHPPGDGAKWTGAAHSVAALFAADLRHELSYPLANLGAVLSAVVLVTGFFFLGRVVDSSAGSANSVLAHHGGDYFQFVMLGLALAGFQAVCITSVGGAIRGRQLTGTLPALMATPISPWRLLAGGAYLPLLRTSVLALIYLCAALEVGHADGSQTLWWLLACMPHVVMMTMLASVGFGMVTAAFLLRYQRGDPVSFLIGIATALLAGIYFPVEVLPAQLQAVGELLPLNHSLAVLRSFHLGPLPAGSQLLGHYVALAMITAVTLPLGVVAIRAALRDALKRGTLGRY